MRRLCVFFLLFLAGCIFPQPIWAFYEKIEQFKGNPLTLELPPGYSTPAQGHVWAQDKLLQAVFVSSHPEQGSALIRMRSDNGIVWTTQYSIKTEGQTISAPFMFIEETGEQLWYASDKQGPFSLYVRPCTESSCSDDDALALAPTAGTWYDQEVASPFVMKRGNTYYLFFSGKPKHGGTWQIGMATSSDGNSWNVCPKSLVREGDGPFVVEHEGAFYLVYHTPFYTGIKIAKVQGSPSCNSAWEDMGNLIKSDQWYNENHSIDPSFVRFNNTPLLYYFGKDVQGAWHVNLATHYKSVIIFLPGMLTSWNEEALLHNNSVDQSQWHIASFVHEYDGLLTTLKKLDYQEGRDVYVFAYDWRQHLPTTMRELHTFIQETLWDFDPVVQVKLVGHSLGGLIARLYTQQYPINVEQLITIGSPHKGTAFAYKPLAAGELERTDTSSWLAAKIVYVLNQTRFDTARETFQKTMPVLFDLFPTYAFLVNSDGSLLQTTAMTLRNELLIPYNAQLGNLSAITTQLYGTSRADTLWGYKVQKANATHALISNYADGQPYESILVEGDYQVPALSRLDGVPDSKLNLDHHQLMYKKEGVAQILTILGVAHNEADIVEGRQTTVSPALVFLKQSPITMRVENSHEVFTEQDGVIMILNAPKDTYRLLITGSGYGAYRIHIGQITAENDVWDTVSGIIPADGQPNLYQSTILFPFDPRKAKPIEKEKLVAVIPFGESTSAKNNTSNESEIHKKEAKNNSNSTAQNGNTQPSQKTESTTKTTKEKNTSPQVLGETAQTKPKHPSRVTLSILTVCTVVGSLWVYWWFYRRRRKRKNTDKIR